MHRRSIIKYLPDLEPLEAKQLLSASPSSTVLAHLAVGLRAPGSHAGVASVSQGPASAIPQTHSASVRRNMLVHGGNSGAMVATSQPVSADAVKPLHGFLIYRITNPNRFNNHLTGPFGQVLVQSRQPVPGRVYNVLQIGVRNGTAQTFTASDGFTVGFPLEHKRFPILTGNEQWKPGQEFIFYVLTKKYYPVPSQIASGFTFILGGAWSVAIPGPSAIFLRVKYDPATFPRTLDYIVAHGQGAQGGIGIKFGLPDTAINEIVSAKTRRNDFGGYF
jgi:hypothetical protein